MRVNSNTMEISISRKAASAIGAMLLALVVALFQANFAASGDAPIDTAESLSTYDGHNEVVTVSAVTDGDTVGVTLASGARMTVRVIGINTPETVDPRRPVECFGMEASARAKELLEGTSVTLLADQSQGDVDKYGRALRYITLADGTDFGDTMIREGFAYEYTYDERYSKQTIYRAAQQTAKEFDSGLWASDTCDGKKDSVIK
jgi:micrococcal nuclease